MSTQIAKRETQVMDALELEGVKNQLADLLAKNPKSIAKFKTKILKMSLNFMLRDCSPESIINCGLQALTLDLPLEAGQGYIVKYGGEAALDVGYKGWSMLAKRCGFSVLGDAVYACDLFNISGFGFNAEIKFEPNHEERKTADDKWVKINLKGVIVSIKDDESGAITTHWVPADMLHKIVGMSPSTQSEKGKKFSPHENWAQQMFIAKALKQVISKMPIDLTKAAALNDAIHIVNQTESAAQQSQPQGLPPYAQSRFDETWPKWVALVESNKKSPDDIKNSLSGGFSLTQAQIDKLETLTNYEPIDGELVDEPVEKTTLSDKEFSAAFKNWMSYVESGEITADEQIASVKGSYELTDKQAESVNALHDCAPVSQGA